MKEQASIEDSAPLADIPMLTEYDAELAKPVSRPVGVYSSDELRSSGANIPTDDLDWSQVVDLRRRVSEMIADEAEEYAKSSGRALTSADRLLLGRSIIRHAVADHVRSLHR